LFRRNENIEYTACYDIVNNGDMKTPKRVIYNAFKGQFTKAAGL